MNHNKIERWLIYINTIALIILGIIQAWVAVSAYNFQVAASRADVSLLINPATSHHWTFEMDGMYLTVDGSLSNEGSRTAVIRRLELSMTYIFSDGNQYKLTTTYLNPDLSCGWDNATIAKGEVRAFSLKMYVRSSLVTNPDNGETLGIGNSRADRVAIAVEYDDGIGILSESKEFPTKPQ